MYIKFDKNGEYGFYTPEIHGEKFCENECTEITDDFYNFLIDNNGKYLINVDSVVDTITRDNLTERPKTPEEPREPTEQEILQEQIKILQETVDMLILDSLESDM
ncbi:MAG: hypothetical protein PHP06_11035 [Clostridia bacterium]|nr:hypothetical protein [Clostridia bacterium]